MILPQPFIDRLNQQFGSTESEIFQKAIFQQPKTAIRIHPKKWKGLLETESPIPWCSEGFFLKSKPSFTLDPLFHGGSYYPQDASSMFLQEALNQIFPANRDLSILDLCASPGGKSTLIASWLGGDGFLVANEVIKLRAQILKENLIKWGYANIAVTNNDPTHFARTSNLFDVVVVDAPCSGEGLFRKDNDAIGEWNIENANLCALRQRRILMDALIPLKPEGVLIYSTCTFNPEENEKNMEWISTQADVEFIDLKIDNQWGVTTVPFKNGNGYGFYPHKVNGEGFFMAILRKKGTPNDSFSRSQKKAKSKDKIILPKDLVTDEDQFLFKKINNQLFALVESQNSLIDEISSHLYPIHYGICLGEESNKGLIPNHSLALSLNLGTHYPKVELNKHEALKFLRGESNFTIEGDAGWNIISYNQLPLGFVKLIQNRFNNYYPKEYRIRMNIE